LDNDFRLTAHCGEALKVAADDTALALDVDSEMVATVHPSSSGAA
jgi:hypothetical protein